MEGVEFIGSWGADKVTGGSGADNFEGRDGNDLLDGGAGNDTLSDGAGTDRLSGGVGDDRFTRTSGTGTDVFAGGTGVDTLYFSFISDASIKIDLADNRQNGGMAKGLTLSGIEGVVGLDRDDDIRGGATNDQLSGMDGGDYLEGRGGNDVIRGGDGADMLIGGAGLDRFVFGADSVGSADLIVDFVRGSDKLQIEREGFGLAANYTISLVLGADPKPTAGVAQFLFETDARRLWFDADGNGADSESVLVATLQGVGTLAASDFVLV
jgi:Ca2+-binding RTX toxin-like protein